MSEADTLTIYRDFLKFTLRRIFRAFLVLFGVTLVVFLIFRVLPGAGPRRRLPGQQHVRVRGHSRRLRIDGGGMAGGGGESGPGSGRPPPRPPTRQLRIPVCHGLPA